MRKDLLLNSLKCIKIIKCLKLQTINMETQRHRGQVDLREVLLAWKNRRRKHHKVWALLTTYPHQSHLDWFLFLSSKPRTQKWSNKMLSNTTLISVEYMPSRISSKRMYIYRSIGSSTRTLMMVFLMTSQSKLAFLLKNCKKITIVKTLSS